MTLAAITAELASLELLGGVDVERLLHLGIAARRAELEQLRADLEAGVVTQRQIERYHPQPRQEGEWTGNLATLRAAKEAQRVAEIAKRAIEAPRAIDAPIVSGVSGANDYDDTGMYRQPAEVAQ